MFFPKFFASKLNKLQFFTLILTFQQRRLAARKRDVCVFVCAGKRKWVVETLWLARRRQTVNEHKQSAVRRGK